MHVSVDLDLDLVDVVSGQKEKNQVRYGFGCHREIIPRIRLHTTYFPLLACGRSNSDVGINCFPHAVVSLIRKMVNIN